MPDEHGAAFVVELSKDGSDWRQVAEGPSGRRSHDFALFDKALTATFLRIRFPSVTPERPAALGEVRVIAKPAQ